MKRKEDQIIKLAFGELDPEEARRLEGQAIHDPKASETLRSYRDLRENLQAMGEVPEHQLSNERLRDAILARGLAQKSPESTTSSSRGWIWVPVTAFALVFAAMMMRHQTPTSQQPNLVMNDNPSSIVSDWPNQPTLDEFVPTHRFEFDVPTPKATQKNPPAPTLASKPSTTPRGNPPVHERVAARSRRGPAPVHYANGKREPIIFHPRPAPPIDDSQPRFARAPKTDEQPIVLIAQEKDAETGAQVATEVQSANVLVGG